MKNATILSCLIFLFKFSFAQTQLPLDPATKLITYTGMVQVPGVSREEMLAKAKRWYDKTFQNASSKEYEMDYGKNELRISRVSFGIDNEDAFIFYNVTISCSDNQYQYKFYNFTHESWHGKGGALENQTPACGNCMSQTAWERTKYQADLNVKILISVLESSMEAKAKK